MRALLLFLLSTAAAFAQPKEITITLSPERWSIVNRALQEAPMPFRETYPILLELARQAGAQKAEKKQN
jgi:hypothetical protein